MKTLAEAQVTTDGRISINANEASSAIVCGCIRQIKESAGYHDMTIEDGTSSLSVRQYLGGDKSPPPCEDLEYDPCF